ncbi:putative reverse transcriptase [Purpureocillium lavendulum]|uniref:Reverse transcriptase n=1 Tax=Purpureocillium lavendulum TaxID=1247861 RepID=A0AB34FEX1_9HYPO|nr:putative reverse transcriptase [Purpureocillium lavendulum]
MEPETLNLLLLAGWLAGWRRQVFVDLLVVEMAGSVEKEHHLEAAQRFITVVLALAATAFAAPGGHGGKTENSVGNVCSSKQTVVCQGQGNGGLITLGNVLPGALGENCAGGDVYCCSHDDVEQAAEYKCPIGPSVAVICDDYAVAAMIAGGTTSTTLGFPAIFFNRAIEDQPPVVFDNAADERCEYEQTELLEFPVNEDGTIFPKNNGGAGAAATRVVYLRDGKALCGVMTHLPPLGRPNTCRVR